jgi:hypothetical protein
MTTGARDEVSIPDEAARRNRPPGAPRCGSPVARSPVEPRRCATFAVRDTTGEYYAIRTVGSAYTAAGRVAAPRTAVAEASL